MKKTLAHLSKIWEKASKLRPTTSGIKQKARVCLKHLNHGLSKHVDKALAATAKFCERLRSGQQPQPAQGINLSGTPCTRCCRTSLRDAPTSHARDIVLLRRSLVKQKQNGGENKYDVLFQYDHEKRRRHSPNLISSLLKESRMHTAYKPKKILSLSTPEAFDSPSQIAKGNCKRRKISEESRRQANIRLEKKRQLEAERALRARNSGQRRWSWLTPTPRRNRRLFADWYPNRRRYEWEKKWQERWTPSICEKRERKPATHLALEERLRQRRRIYSEGFWKDQQRRRHVLFGMRGSI